MLSGQKTHGGLSMSKDIYNAKPKNNPTQQQCTDQLMSPNSPHLCSDNIDQVHVGVVKH